MVENLRIQLSEFPTFGGRTLKQLGLYQFGDIAAVAHILPGKCAKGSGGILEPQMLHVLGIRLHSSERAPTSRYSRHPCGPVMVGSLGMEVHNHLGGMRAIETAIRPKLLKSRVDDENRPLSRFAGRQR